MEPNTGGEGPIRGQKSYGGKSPRGQKSSVVNVQGANVRGWGGLAGKCPAGKSPRT